MDDGSQPEPDQDELSCDHSPCDPLRSATTKTPETQEVVAASSTHNLQTAKWQAVLWAAVLGVFLSFGGAAGSLRAAEDSSYFEFRGQVVLPPDTLSPYARIVVALHGISAPFRARTSTDSKGRFRVRKVPPGTYSLTFVLPTIGEILETVELTESFADAGGRVERTFAFDAAALQERAHPRAADTVSLRELSIPYQARQEYEKAQSRLRSRDLRGAVEHLNKAIGLAPEFPDALNNLGTIALQQGDMASAEQFFRNALQQEPDAFQPLVNLGGVLLTQGRKTEALEVSRRAQECRPQDALANAQLGLSYYLLGDYDRATPYLERTKELDPAHFTTPQIPLADIYQRSNREEEALQQLEDFIQEHPDSPHVRKVRTVMERIRQGIPFLIQISLRFF